MRSGVGLVHHNQVSGYMGGTSPLFFLNDRNADAYPPFNPGNVVTAVLSTDVSLGAFQPLTAGTIISIRGADQPVFNTLAGLYDVTENSVRQTDIVNDHTFTYVLDFGAGAPTTPATGSIYAFAGGYFSEIESNTENTITYRSARFGPQRFLNFARMYANEKVTFSLWKVRHSMDQPGRKGGSLISEDTPSRPVAWNDQVTSPWYEWENTRENGIKIGFSPVHKTIRLNEHYISGVPGGYTPFGPHPLDPD